MTSVRSVSALAVVAAVSASALAQSGGDAVIDRCRQIDDAQGRIACLEAAVLALAAAGDRSPGALPATAADPIIDADPGSGESSSVPDQASTVDDQMPTISPAAAPPADGGDGRRESGASQVTAHAATAGVTTPGQLANTATAEVTEDEWANVQPASREESIGVEQVEALTRTRDEHLASLEEARNLPVEKFEKVGYRQLQVHLENGQIWRQIRGDVQDIRVTVQRNPTVDIVESSLGGYRLQLNEIRRTIRVRRVR